MPSRELGNAKIHYGVIERGNFRLGVREQLEAQAFLSAELLVGIFVLYADTNDDGVLLFVLCQVALEVMGFDCASAGKIFRVEIEHYPLALKIVKANRLGLLGIQRKVRRGGTNGRRLTIRAHSADPQP